MVTFRYKYYRSQRARSLTLPLAEFVRRFLLHTLPKGFVRIRYYGFLANGARARWLPRCRSALGSVPPPAEPHLERAPHNELLSDLPPPAAPLPSLQGGTPPLRPDPRTPTSRIGVSPCRRLSCGLSIRGRRPAASLPILCPPTLPPFTTAPAARSSPYRTSTLSPASLRLRTERRGRSNLHKPTHRIAAQLNRSFPILSTSLPLQTSVPRVWKQSLTVRRPVQPSHITHVAAFKRTTRPDRHHHPVLGARSYWCRVLPASCRPGPRLYR